MANRTDLINFLIKKHALKRYLEVGLQDSTQNFDKIECDFKTSVDPDSKANATHCMTSDMFFKLKSDKYDLIFIDGLHTAEQVKKDFENALMVLSRDGFIVLHDCNPLKKEHTLVPRPSKTGHWNGDVYKFACQLSVYPNFQTIDIDNGCGVWQDTYYSFYHNENFVIDWEDFNEKREMNLNLISWDDYTNSHV